MLQLLVFFTKYNINFLNFGFHKTEKNGRMKEACTLLDATSIHMYDILFSQN